MPYNDTEIEIKIKIDKDSFSKVREKVENCAKFVKKVQQSDEYFTPAHRNFLEPKFAKILGVDVSNPDLRGYPFLLMEKLSLIRKPF